MVQGGVREKQLQKKLHHCSWANAKRGLNTFIFRPQRVQLSSRCSAKQDPELQTLHAAQSRASHKPGMSLPLPLELCPPPPGIPLPSGATDLREEEVPALIARQHVVHQHRGPRAVLAEPHLVGTLGAQCPGDHHPLHQLWPLSQHGQGAQEPADRTGRSQQGQSQWGTGREQVAAQPCSAGDCGLQPLSKG